MDPHWLVYNIREGLRHGCSPKDTINFLRWSYSTGRPWLGWSGSRVIQFKYPAPVGTFRAAVRCNRGADSYIFSELFFYYYYDLPLASAPQTILDLGANAGFTTLYFSRKYPAAEIACVEPMPGNIECLKLNLTLNAVPARVFEAAIAPQDGTLSMAINEMDWGHHVCEESAADGRGGTLPVRAISIPTCMNEMKWQRISLLKMDIEGYETVLLAEKCEWLQLVDALCIEWHAADPGANLRKLADEWGFREPELLSGIWLLKRDEGSAGGPVRCATSTTQPKVNCGRPKMLDRFRRRL